MILGINYLRFVPGAVLDMGMSIRLNNPFFFSCPGQKPRLQEGIFSYLVCTTKMSVDSVKI